MTKQGQHQQIEDMNTLPILYSFRRCPFAIRARMGLAYAQIDFEHREVELKHKPAPMLEISPKGTVPVLLLPDGEVLDESLDILNWAIAQQDLGGWKHFSTIELNSMAELIQQNDTSFKLALDHYKYADRYPELSKEAHREKCSPFLAELESALKQPAFKDSAFLFGDRISYADIAITSFIRQFSMVDAKWFATCPYPNLRKWLAFQLHSELFLSVMTKHPRWMPQPAT